MLLWILWQYFGRQLLHIYKTWNKSTLVSLLRGNQSWELKVHRYKKNCRFGRGWDAFVKDNGFIEGDRVQFTHITNSTFRVIRGADIETI